MTPDEWALFAARLQEGDGGGSLAGAAFIIASTACSDVPGLLEAVERLQEIETEARGLVRTAHPSDVGKHEVVRQWWAALVQALSPEEATS